MPRYLTLNASLYITSFSSLSRLGEKVGVFSVHICVPTRVIMLRLPVVDGLADGQAVVDLGETHLTRVYSIPANHKAPSQPIGS